MSNVLLIIDPQNDFCSPKGSLFVPGAPEDCHHLAAFIDSHSDQIDEIHVTLDSHPCFHIAHPYFWIDSEGKNPDPYTIITYQDFADKKYQPAQSKYTRLAEEYLLSLENRGRYVLTIWPPHCLIGTWGGCVEDGVMNSLLKWQIGRCGTNVDFVHKATNPFTEHYSAVQAEVPDPSDPATRTNFSLIDSLKQPDRIFIAGEALSHCVANTIRDLSVYLPVYRMTLLTDCSSNVTGFEGVGDDFVHEYKSKGMQFLASTEVQF